MWCPEWVVETFNVPACVCVCVFLCVCAHARVCVWETMRTKGEEPGSQQDKERQTERERMNWNNRKNLEIKNHRSGGETTMKSGGVQGTCLCTCFSHLCATGLWGKHYKLGEEGDCLFCLTVDGTQVLWPSRSARKSSCPNEAQVRCLPSHFALPRNRLEMGFHPFLVPAVWVSKCTASPCGGAFPTVDLTRWRVSRQDRPEDLKRLPSGRA